MVSGKADIKLAIIMVKPSVSPSYSGIHRLKCLATVVSRSWSMSLKCPWNLVIKRFLVCPTFCMPHVVQVIMYTKLELWQLIFFMQLKCLQVVVECIVPVWFSILSSNLVYIITCNTCGIQYVGQTKKKVK